MNTLDSRFCRVGDTFAQRFTEPGNYAYDFNLPGLPPFGHANRFSISVKGTFDNNKEGKQHFVTVRREGTNFVADPPKLEIETGDVVLWNTNEANTAGFSISGKSETDSFNSGDMERNALYSHAFGSPGEIEWLDANAHGPAGKITVKMPKTDSAKDMEAFKETLTQGAVIIINGKKADKTQVEIFVGQTVFFAVEKAEGIAITERNVNVPVPQPPVP
jgi:plastocyanin